MIRIPTGILAVILLLSGAFLHFFQPDANPVAAAMMIRIGALLGVIWLAFPQLEALKGRLPSILIALVFICLAVAAAKPKLGALLATIVTIAISVGAALKWMSKVADNDPKRKR